MKHFYYAPTAVYAATPPRAPHEAQPTPDDPMVTMVIIDGWPDHAAQDAWEALPGVDSYPVWSWGQPAPAKLVLAHAKAGASVGETVGQVMERVRKGWRAARP